MEDTNIVSSMHTQYTYLYTHIHCTHTHVNAYHAHTQVHTHKQKMIQTNPKVPDGFLLTLVCAAIVSCDVEEAGLFLGSKAPFQMCRSLKQGREVAGEP